MLKVSRNKAMVEIETESSARFPTSESVAQLTPRRAFELAEQLCAVAYEAQGGPFSDENDGARLAMYDEQEAHGASYFERLYHQIRNMADDWHRESQERYLGLASGAYSHDYLDATKAIESTFRKVFEHVADWDY